MNKANKDLKNCHLKKHKITVHLQNLIKKDSSYTLRQNFKEKQLKK